MKKNDIFVNHMSNTIYVTASFIKKAGIPGTAEYELFKTMKNENPAYKIERRTVSSSKKVYKGLSIERMRAYIEYKEGNGSEMLVTFNRVCEEAKIRGHAYPRAKSWFIHMYKDYASDPNWNVAEDNEQDEEEITAA